MNGLGSVFIPKLSNAPGLRGSNLLFSLRRDVDLSDTKVSNCVRNGTGSTHDEIIQSLDCFII